jgi:FkbM family methyltransferase
MADLAGALTRRLEEAIACFDLAAGDRGGAHLTRRLEEAIAYFAARANPYYHTNPVYIGDHTVLALLHGRYPMYLDTRGIDVAPFIMLFGIWEQHYTTLFTRLIRPGDTVLDIGAHLGVYTLLSAAATGPTGRVHAFEPNARFAQLLGKSLASNGFSGYSQIHPVAVGAQAGDTELRFSWEWAGGGHLAAGPGEETLVAQPCRIVAIDDVFPDPSSTVDLIKMDVEGTETFAIRGMVRLLARSPGVRIMFEFSPEMLAGHGSSGAELISLFQGFGFRFWTIEQDSSLTPVPPEALAAKTDGVANILASRQDPFPA